MLFPTLPITKGLHYTVAPLIFPVQEVSISSSRQHGGQNICEKHQMSRTSSARGSAYLLDRESEWCYSDYIGLPTSIFVETENKMTLPWNCTLRQHELHFTIWFSPFFLLNLFNNDSSLKGLFFPFIKKKTQKYDERDYPHSLHVVMKACLMTASVFWLMCSASRK